MTYSCYEVVVGFSRKLRIDVKIEWIPLQIWLPIMHPLLPNTLPSNCCTVSCVFPHMPVYSDVVFCVYFTVSCSCLYCVINILEKAGQKASTASYSKSYCIKSCFDDLFSLHEAVLWRKLNVKSKPQYFFPLLICCKKKQYIQIITRQGDRILDMQVFVSKGVMVIQGSSEERTAAMRSTSNRLLRIKQASASSILQAVRRAWWRDGWRRGEKTRGRGSCHVIKGEDKSWTIEQHTVCLSSLRHLWMR